MICSEKITQSSHAQQWQLLCKLLADRNKLNINPEEVGHEH